MPSFGRFVAYFSASLMLGGAALAAPSSPQRTSSVTITEVNLDWFGLAGSPSNTTDDETRGPSIREYFMDHHLLADVMIFEEIVDLDMLENDVLDGAYKCHSYDRKDPKHQHVVICNDPKFDFVAADSSGYALESVDVSGHLRPAVHGILKDKSGKSLAHIFGVHLKAMPEQSSVRLNQTQQIADYLSQREDDAPVIIMGDFNTYASDPADMESMYKGAGLVELSTPEPFTWAEGKSKYAPAKFDRIWMSDDLSADVEGDDIVGPCSSGDTNEIDAYNAAVSDHCPVTVSLSL